MAKRREFFFPSVSCIVFPESFHGDYRTPIAASGRHEVNALRRESVFEDDGMKLRVNLLSFHDMDEDMIKQWYDLEMRSKDGNAYLSPSFILPAIKYLTPSRTPSFMTVTKISDSTSVLIGLGIFEYSAGTKYFPFPHLTAYRTLYSFVNRLLIDDEHIQASIDAIFNFTKSMHGIFGIELFDVIENSELSRQLDTASIYSGMPYYLYNRKKRSIITPKNVYDNDVQNSSTCKKRRSFRKEYKYLSKIGTVQWKIVSGHQVDEIVISRFMEIENMGWKGEGKTSLLSNPDDERFFRETIRNFSRNDRVFFTELMVNDKVISSTANFISSHAGYAFKTGMDPAFAKGAPGKINDLELVKNADKLFFQFDYIDSGAEEGSYIDEIYPGHYVLRSGIFATKKAVVPVMDILGIMRRLKRRFFSASSG